MHTDPQSSKTTTQPPAWAHCDINVCEPRKVVQALPFLHMATVRSWLESLKTVRLLLEKAGSVPSVETLKCPQQPKQEYGTCQN